jgi:hypothetical protein
MSWLRSAPTCLSVQCPFCPLSAPIKGSPPMPHPTRAFCPCHPTSYPPVMPPLRAPLFWLPQLTVDSPAHHCSLPQCRSWSSTIARSCSPHHRTSIFSSGEPPRHGCTGEFPLHRELVLATLSDGCVVGRRWSPWKPSHQPSSRQPSPLMTRALCAVAALERASRALCTPCG